MVQMTLDLIVDERCEEERWAVSVGLTVRPKEIEGNTTYVPLDYRYPADRAYVRIMRKRAERGLKVRLSP